MIRKKKKNAKPATDSKPAALLVEIKKQTLLLENIQATLVRILIAEQPVPTSLRRAPGAVAAGPETPRQRAMRKLRRCFSADGQNGDTVQPEMVLGDDPLGYNTLPALRNFYTLFIRPAFGVNVSANRVGPSDTVNDLLNEIIAQGGR